MRFIGIVTFAAAALGCSSGLTRDLPAYWPSNDYRNLTCSELAEEGRKISKRGFMLSFGLCLDSPRTIPEASSHPA
jgi:hypothetical protein